MHFLNNIEVKIENQRKEDTRLGEYILCFMLEVCVMDFKSRVMDLHEKVESLPRWLC